MKYIWWILYLGYVAALPIYLSFHIGDTIVQQIDYIFVFGTCMLVAIPFAMGYLLHTEEPDQLAPKTLGKRK